MTPERCQRHRRRSCVVLVNFEHTSPLLLGFLLLSVSRLMFAWLPFSEFTQELVWFFLLNTISTFLDQHSVHVACKHVACPTDLI